MDEQQTSIGGIDTTETGKCQICGLEGEVTRFGDIKMCAKCAKEYGLRDTWYTTFPTCPHCGFVDDDNCEYNDGDECECGKCGNPFMVRVDTTVNFTTTPLPLVK